MAREQLLAMKRAKTVLSMWGHCLGIPLAHNFESSRNHCCGCYTRSHLKDRSQYVAVVGTIDAGASVPWGRCSVVKKIAEEENVDPNKVGNTM